MWKCQQNCLPVNEITFKRFGKGEGRCDCYGENVETIEHLLFFCTNVAIVWKLAPVRWDGLKDKQHNLWLWWEMATQSISKEQEQDRINLTINIFWQIWKARNKKKVFENSSPDSCRTIQKAQNDWIKYEQAREMEQENIALHINSEPQVRRETPKEDVICSIRMLQSQQKWSGHAKE